MQGKRRPNQPLQLCRGGHFDHAYQAVTLIVAVSGAGRFAQRQITVTRRGIPLRKCGADQIGHPPHNCNILERRAAL